MAQRTATTTLNREELKRLIGDALHETLRDTLREVMRDTMRELLSEMLDELLPPRLDALAARLEDKMEGLIFELEQQLPDPDEGLEFKPEVIEYLQKALKERKRGIPLDEIVRELGLDD